MADARYTPIWHLNTFHHRFAAWNILIFEFNINCFREYSQGVAIKKMLLESGRCSQGREVISRGKTQRLLWNVGAFVFYATPCIECKAVNNYSIQYSIMTFPLIIHLADLD